MARPSDNPPPVSMQTRVILRMSMVVRPNNKALTLALDQCRSHWLKKGYPKVQIRVERTALIPPGERMRTLMDVPMYSKPDLGLDPPGP